MNLIFMENILNCNKILFEMFNFLLVYDYVIVL